jgi:hypothetical protein
MATVKATISPGSANETKFKIKNQKLTFNSGPDFLKTKIKNFKNYITENQLYKLQVGDFASVFIAEEIIKLFGGEINDVKLTKDEIANIM